MKTKEELWILSWQIWGRFSKKSTSIGVKEFQQAETWAKDILGGRVSVEKGRTVRNVKHVLEQILI